MALTLLFVLSLFVTIWQTVLFVGNALNKTLKEFRPFNCFIYAVSLTAVITRFMNIW